MLALPISKPRFKALSFYQNSPTIKLFLQKNAKFLSAGAPPPDPRASGGWGLRLQTPISLRRLEVRPQTQKSASPLHCKFLAWTGEC